MYREVPTTAHTKQAHEARAHEAAKQRRNTRATTRYQCKTTLRRRSGWPELESNEVWEPLWYRYQPTWRRTPRRRSHYPVLTPGGVLQRCTTVTLRSIVSWRHEHKYRYCTARDPAAIPRNLPPKVSYRSTVEFWMGPHTVPYHPSKAFPTQQASYRYDRGGTKCQDLRKLK